jgi:hypothetical protein
MNIFASAVKMSLCKFISKLPPYFASVFRTLFIPTPWLLFMMAAPYVYMFQGLKTNNKIHIIVKCILNGYTQAWPECTCVDNFAGYLYWVYRHC